MKNSRQLWTVAIGRAVSLCGDEAALVALSLRLEGKGAAPWTIAALFVAGLLPLVALAGPVGRLVDRADSRTLLVTSSSFVVNPSFHKKLPFDVVRDFEPVSNLAVTEAYILGVNPGLPVRTVQELIALARRSDSKISFGSPGVGNGLHLAAELFKSLTRTQMVHVPYRGAAPAITGLIAGDVQVMFMTPPSSLPFIEGEKIRALGYTGARRFARLPDVPTMAEAGVTGMEGLASWTGMFAPAKTPDAVLARLQEEVQRAVATATMRERLTAIGVIPLGSAPAEFKPFVAAQVKQIADIVRAAGIEPQ
jgi:tripartite-type tricarboxylate transporter receptor subunit TctC